MYITNNESVIITNLGKRLSFKKCLFNLCWWKSWLFNKRLILRRQTYPESNSIEKSRSIWNHSTSKSSRFREGEEVRCWSLENQKSMKDNLLDTYFYLIFLVHVFQRNLWSRNFLLQFFFSFLYTDGIVILMLLHNKILSYVILGLYNLTKIKLIQSAGF